MAVGAEMYGEVKIVGRAVPMPLGCALGVKDSGSEGELVYEMDESVSAEKKAIEGEGVYARED